MNRNFAPIPKVSKETKQNTNLTQTSIKKYLKNKEHYNDANDGNNNYNSIDDNNNKNGLLELSRINKTSLNRFSSIESHDISRKKDSNKYEKFMSILKINKNLESSNRNRCNNFRIIIYSSTSLET